MAQLSKLSRRQFMQMTGLGTAGLALSACVKHDESATKPVPLTQTSATGKPAELNVFVHIGSNNRVTIMAHRSEMGQGIRTSLPQVVADELDADWDKVDILQAQGDKKYGDQNTDGSQSARQFYKVMRNMGGAAKLMLRQAAAAQWQVPLESCIAKDHRVTHAGTGKSLSYGELAEGAAKQPLPDVKTLQLKNPDEFKYIGKPVTMVDFTDIVRGSTHYGIDTILPDMVHASIERCPYYCGGIESFDDTKARAVPGVLQVIKIDGAKEIPGFTPLTGLAVIATNTWAALEGRKALVVKWDKGAHGAHDSRATIAALVKAPIVDAKDIRVRGDIEQALKTAAKTHEAVYTTPYMEHATMEPPAATARFTGEACEIWACTQNPQGAIESVSQLLGIKPEQITVNVTLLGGAFGRKSKPDFIGEAAYLAKATGKPVRVTWSREDTIRMGYYHAFSVQHFKAALNKQQQIIGLDSRIVSPSIRSLNEPDGRYMQNWEIGQGFNTVPYDIPNVRVRNTPAPTDTRIGWLRSVYHQNHAFALNSFIDELARLNKKDSLEFQLAAIGADRPTGDGNNCDVARLKNVLRTVAQTSGWPAKVGASEGWGIATHFSFDSYVAVASKVRVDKTGLRILEVHLALDCGQMINPDRVHSQMEGSVIFALSSVLFGEITFKDGVVEQSSFDNYLLLRMNQSPKIVITLIPSDKKHTGVGEPGVCPVPASVANAIVAAGGPRIRELPLKNHLNIL